MANKRELKKAIHAVTAVLFTESVMFKEFIPKTDVEKADLLMDEILIFRERNIRLVNSYKSSASAKTVRTYFKKLSNDIVTEAHELFDKINGLNK